MTTTQTRPGPQVSSGPSIARRLGELVEPIFGGELPLRLRTPDGGEYGPEGAPVITISSPDALRRLLFHPGELGLAQAYVTGEIDVEGDLLDGFRRVWRLYMVGSALSFEENRMGVDQILAVKPCADGVSGMPPVRTW